MSKGQVFYILKPNFFNKGLEFLLFFPLFICIVSSSFVSAGVISSSSGASNGNLFNVSPRGSLPSWAYYTNISFTTDVSVSCKISTNSSTTYAGIKDVTADAFGTSHSFPVTALVPGKSYTYYVYCQDSNGNQSPISHVDFSVDTDTVLPQIVGLSAPFAYYDTAIIQWNTTKPSDTLVEYGTTVGVWTPTEPDYSLAIPHAVTLNGLKPGTKYYYRVTCRDKSNHKVVSDINSFTTLSNNYAKVFYVTVDGSNTKNGQPAMTLANAIAAVRNWRQAPLSNGAQTNQSRCNSPVMVWLQGGTYRLSSPLLFDSKDSGTAACPTIFSGNPNESVVISGGKAITGFSKVNSSDAVWNSLTSVPAPAQQQNVYKVSLPQGTNYGNFYSHMASNSNPPLELFLNGKRMTLSRYPKGLGDAAQTTFENAFPNNGDAIYSWLLTNNILSGNGWVIGDLTSTVVLNAIQNKWPTEYQTIKNILLHFGNINITSVNGFMLTVSIAGSGTITSNLDGINCPNQSTCIGFFNSGTSVTLTAAPVSGANFTGWSGAGCSGTGTCVVKLNSNQTLTANFTSSSVAVKPTISSKVSTATIGYDNNESEPAKWKWNLKDIWAHGQFTYTWYDDYESIKSIDTNNHTLTLIAPLSQYGYVKAKSWPACAGWFYFLNILEELAPGEYYLDRNTGMLYFWPPAGFDPNSGKAEVSMANDLIDMNGWGKGVSNIILDNLTFEEYRMTAISLYLADKIWITNSVIHNGGAYGLNINAITNSGIYHSQIYDIGASGVFLRGGDKKTLTSGNNFELSNSIHNTAIWDATASGFSMIGTGNYVAHNEIFNLPYGGISFSGNNNIVEFNNVYDGMHMANDGGGIYTWPDTLLERGNVIKYNYVHDIFGVPGNASADGIYLDEGSPGNLVYGNVVYNITPHRSFLSAGSFQVGGGRNNIIQNNIVVTADPVINMGVWSNVAQRMATLTAYDYKSPPYSTYYPEETTLTTGSGMNPEGSVINSNIFYNVTGSWFMNNPNQVWQPYIDIQNNNLINTDPHFVDLAKNNFQLKDDSPAYDPSNAIGFKRIPFEKIGPFKKNTTMSLSTDSTVYTAGLDGKSSITLTAAASTSITNVKFFNNGQLILNPVQPLIMVAKTSTLSLSNAPYSVTIKNVPVGAYSFTATALDSTGAVVTSAPVNVTVKANIPPTVNLSIASADGKATPVEPANLILTATVSDSDGSVMKVEFCNQCNWADERALKWTGSKDADGIWKYVWTKVPKGTYNLTARATDNLGASAISKAVGVTVSSSSGNVKIGIVGVKSEVNSNSVKKSINL